jgi:hypothetical protein
MFPFFEPIEWFIVYSFWITISICFFLFLWMLKKLSYRFNYDYSIFTRNILWYFLSIFLFSRLFYVIWKWNDLKYIKRPLEFFIMNDYNFSLFWAIFWFFIILILNLKLRDKKIRDYIDWITISFLFILIFWFIWAFFWWQVFWRETSFGIEILYSNPYTPVPYQVKIFPLAIIYSIIFFIEFSVLYILSMFIKIKWFLWYIWLIVFWSIILIFEYFTWKYDILKDFININFAQVFSIIIILIAITQLYKVLKEK